MIIPSVGRLTTKFEDDEKKMKVMDETHKHQRTNTVHE